MTNIHIRFEDSLSNPGHPMAMGLTLNSLTAETTDENWEPTFAGVQCMLCCVLCAVCSVLYAVCYVLLRGWIAA